MTALSWNTIRARAKAFARDWKDKGYEKGETQLFYREFFDLFGRNVKQLGTFEEPVKKLGNKRGYIDLLWPGTLLVEQKSKGSDLQEAFRQAKDYLLCLAPERQPRYLLLCDFQRFELHDLHAKEGDGITRLTLADLAEHVQAFAFIRGDVEAAHIQQEQVTIAAAEQIGRLHDLLAADGFGGEDLQLLLIRIVFCLFADDTGIFEQRASLLTTLKNRTASGSNDLGAWLQRLFDTLNTPEEQRQKSLDEELAQFPYINGALFERATRIPTFTADMNTALITACEFDWRHVSPAIFGSLFQSVMDAKQRREQGAHYTSEKHIRRLIGPLFVDALEAEFESIRNDKTQKKAKFEKYQVLYEKIARLTFFDPACGCGNFLVVTYQNIRQLETRLLQELHRLNPDSEHGIKIESQIDVDRFYGIELGAFPAKIAQIALWMTDHLCNLELSAAFGEHYARIPLKKSPHIHCADALEVDWHSVLPAVRCSYVLGNPPFGGAKFQSEAQRQQVRRIANLGKTGGTLDYVCAWFIKAAEYAAACAAECAAAHAARNAAKIAPKKRGKPQKKLPAPPVPPQIAFVATNSITQGEQVAQLWPLLFERYGLEISFAHRTFDWESEARGKAHVHVVIVGLTVRAYAPAQRQLFHYDGICGEPSVVQHKSISPYLIDGGALNNPYLVVKEEARSLMGYPALIIGSKPIDGGIYIFSAAEKDTFLQTTPAAAPFMRPFIGGCEFINGTQRWILTLHQASPAQLRQMPLVLERVEAVRKYRLASKSKPTQKLAETPTKYHVNVIPKNPFLALPQVSSENRDYIPIGYLEPPIIPSSQLKIIENAQLWQFAILTSRMHMAWMRQFAGRLKSDYRYSVGTVYNPFPWPEGLQTHTQAQEELNQLAQAVLDARAAHPDSTLADLYDRRSMPFNLRKAHTRLDKAVDRLYSATTFKDDAARVALLLARYEAMTRTPP